MSMYVNGYDQVTGEYVGEFHVKETVEETQTKKESAIKRKETNEFYKELVAKNGEFYFLFNHLNSSELEKQHMIRFLYLCTFMDRENILIYKSEYMTENNLHEVLNLAKPVAKKTRIAFIENNLMSIDEKGRLIINRDFCFKGKIGKEQKQSMKTRMFGRAIRELYEKALPREHKKLSLLVTLLPFISFYHNILCHEPEYIEKCKIESMNLSEVADILKYSVNQVSRLKKDLFALRVGGELVIMVCTTDKAEIVKINPKVYYRASDKSSFNDLEDEFLIVNKK